MKRIYDRVCGLDVHRDVVNACVRLPEHSEDDDGVVAKFGTTTAELLALRDWLVSHKVTHVAMESTGEYWRPIYYTLEDQFKLLVVNAHHVKHVPGHKTDRHDCIWLARLLQCGLLKASFVPPRPIRDLRDLTRYRKVLTYQRTEEVQRLHGMLQKAGIKLSSVASDITGVSGRAMIEALVAGTADPEALADLARGRLRSKIPLLQKALLGHFRPHHATVVTEMLAQMDSIEESLERLTKAIEEEISPYAEAKKHLKTIPGWQDKTAETVLAEIGADMSAFPTDGDLASWAGICPGNRRSAGKRQTETIRKGNRWLRAALVQAAWAAIQENKSYLSAQYHRLAGHRGKKKAVVAVAHSMLVIAYHLLSKGADYQDLGPDFFLKRNRDAIQRRCIRQLESLGYDVALLHKNVA
jgi:transposase